MFGLFKRSKIQDWELQLINNVILSLPEEYSDLMNSINEGLFKGVLTDISDIPGYVSFTFNPSILREYERESERDFKLTNIKVYDKVSSGYLSYEVYVSSGTINGYAINGQKNHKIDVDRIDVSRCKKVYIDGLDYNRIVKFFSKEENGLVNPSQVYSVYIKGQEYFHLKDVDDGDFAGLDENNNLYKITHDPLSVSAIGRDELSKILKNGHF